MKKIENKDLKSLYKAFKSSMTYIERLRFFDVHFGISPFSFPPFQPNLDVMFEGKNGKFLMELFEMERHNKANKEDSFYLKSFNYFGKEYHFNITPTNSLRELYNGFIVHKFINEDRTFKEKVNALKQLQIEDRAQLNVILNEDIINIKMLENHAFDFQQKATLKNQFLNVFHTGFNDYNNGFIKSFPNKKKHIELYLYAHGVLQAKYHEEIKKYYPSLMTV
jgi:hypothetical protein